MNTLAFTPATYEFSDLLIVFAFHQYRFFSLLQSSIHTVWLEKYASSMRTDIRYTPSTCFETFPFPHRLEALDSVGEKYHEHRRRLMLERNQGLTATYNRFHDPDDNTKDTQKLREMHIGMDKDVAIAYGWTDLDLGHGFHMTKQGIRFMISEPTRREVLARLLKLNHERHAEEVFQGVHDKKNAAKTPKWKLKSDPDPGPKLFS
jgi:hypothetical protein